jgi:hypothetical protein
MRARRRAVVDEYVEDGRAAVYSHDGVVLLLSELGASAWGTLTDDWVRTDQVTAELVREFGEPTEGGAGQLTENALRLLADMHLVDLDEEDPT